MQLTALPRADSQLYSKMVSVLYRPTACMALHSDLYMCFDAGTRRASLPWPG